MNASIRKILFLATYFPDPRNSSRGNWALEQAQAFKAAGMDIRVVVPTPWIPRIAGKRSAKLETYASVPRSHTFDGLEVHYPRWACYPWHVFNRLNQSYPQLLNRVGWWFLRPWMKRFLRDFRPDAIVAHHTLVAGQLARRIHQSFAIPYVVTDHEVGDILSAAREGPVRECFVAVGSSAVGMIMVSHQMEKLARESFPSMPLGTIYNGSSFPAFFERRWKGKDEPLTLLCCAKFYGRKDIPLLMRAFDVLADKGYPIKLRIGGDGPDRAIIEDLHRSLRNRDKIELLGLLSTQQVAFEMREADIFALVGWAEPFGVVFLEAMASALPVVVSSDAGVAEVLQDGVTALFSQPRDQRSVESALERLILEPTLRQRLGEAARDLYVEEFSWRKVINQYIHLLEAAIARPSPLTRLP